MKAHFAEGACKFLYSDTDSMILEITTEQDIYQVLQHPDIINEFDFNGSKICKNDNASSVPGFMKLEPKTDCQVAEFIGLFNKGDAAKIVGPQEDGKLHPKEPYKCTSKGFHMPSNQKTFETYKKCLFEDIHDEVKQTRLRSRDHTIYVKTRSV